MSIGINDIVSDDALHFLRRCFRFVNEEWQHAVRELLPDQGFELRFRENCATQLQGWAISQEREMHLGYGIDTASGVSHEVDIMARHSSLTAIVEIKNRLGYPPEKNDIVIFFAKIFDYLALNPVLTLEELCPIFLSNSPFELSGLAACIGLGIHPVAPSLRPLPMLVHNSRCLRHELEEGLYLNVSVLDQFHDFCAELNNISSRLSETWMSSRCGYLSDSSILLRAVGGLPTLGLAHELLKLNSDCTRLLEQFRIAKSEMP